MWHVGTDLGAAPDCRPGIDHRVLADPGADIHKGRHQHHAFGDEGAAADDGAGHRAEAGRLEACRCPVAGIWDSALSHQVALAGAALRQRPCRSGGRKAAPLSSATGGTSDSPARTSPPRAPCRCRAVPSLPRPPGERGRAQVDELSVSRASHALFDGAGEIAHGEILMLIEGSGRDRPSRSRWRRPAAPRANATARRHC